MAHARTAIVLVAIAGLAGCSSGSDPTAPRDGGPTAHADATLDAPAGDASHPKRDATRDARLDTGPHPPDAARDATTTDAAHRDGAIAPDAPRTDAPTSTTLTLSLPLIPAFSTAITDYYVRCAAGENAIDVTMTAAPGSTIALMQPVTTHPAVEKSVSVHVDEGAAIVVGVTTGSTTDAYWVRCLPADFATMDFALHPEAGTPTPGYYLLGDIFNDAPVQGGYAMVLDSNGVPVWYGQTESGVEAVDVDSLTPGTLSYTPYIAFTFADAAVGEFEIHDLEAGTASYVDSVGVPLDLHELQKSHDGNYYVLASPILPGKDLTGLQSFGPDENEIGCIIQEVDPEGNLLWSWDALDHFDPVKDSTYPIEKPQGATTTVNTIHCNSIDVTPSGDLLVSARCMDSVFLVSRAHGNVIWKMGGATYSKDGAPYIAVTGDPMTSFYRQHDVRYLTDTTLSMLDDHTSVSSGAARGVIYQYDVAAGTATVVWQYALTLPSYAMGSFRLTEDGSRIMSWGSNPTNAGFTEVDEAGHDLLDFTFPDNRWTYRAIKLPTTALDLATLRRTSGTL